jgi:hypothetical protein
MAEKANVSQTTSLPELKAPSEANMSQKEISANMNLPNTLGEPPVQDEDVNLHEQSVEGEERSLSGIVVPMEITYMDTEDEYKYMVSKIHIFKVHTFKLDILYLWITKIDIFKLHILHLEITRYIYSNPFLGFQFLPWACLISLYKKS